MATRPGSEHFAKRGAGSSARRPFCAPEAAGGARGEYRSGRAKTQHGMLLSAVLAVIGLGVLTLGPASIPDSGLIGAVNLALAAGVLIVVVRAGRDRRPRMVIDPEGLWYRDWKIGKVAWTQVAGASLGGSRLMSFVVLRLHDPDGFVATLPQAERASLRSNRLVRLPELRIPNGAVETSLDELLATIRTSLAAARGASDGSN